VPGLNDPDSVRLQAAASVLGGLASSRLDNALVRSEKIVVSTSSSAQIFQHAGVFGVQADVKPSVDPALVGKRMDEVIAQFLAEGPTSDELSRAATGVIAGAIRGFESVGGFSGKAVALAEGELYSNDSSFYKKEALAWAALTPEEVKTAANKWLSRPVYALTIEPGERTESGAERGGAVISGPERPVSSPAFYKAPGSDDSAASKPAANVDRSKLPEVGSLASLDFPSIERAKLKNGIEVFYAQRAAVPVTRMVVSFDAGYAADPKDALGTQSLMLALMTEGTTSRTSVQIAEETERLGAGLGSNASLDRTGFSLTALTPNLGPSVALLADVVRNPKFDPAEVERLRATQMTRIASELNNPAQIAARVLLPALYGAKHPYGVPPSGLGDPAVVAKLSPDDLRKFHTMAIRPSRARILVVSSAGLAEVLPHLETHFGAWPENRMLMVKKDFKTKIPAAQHRIILVDRPKSPQSVIAAGQVLDAAGRDDLVTLQAANEVLGGSFLSRINMNLRETKGWSYGSRSSISDPLESASYQVRAPVQADKTGASIKEILSDIDQFLTAKPVQANELERTVNGNVRGLPGSFETAQAVLAGLSNIVNLGRPDDYYETLAAKYKALTTQDLDNAARAKIDPKKLLFVVVGDASVVKPQLEGLGLPVEVIPAPAIAK
ncbi:MAG TPA: peptidase M16, partial [Alphaproteobacteria bacterium]|nr:peptidase M16 [Alphaproteobacteria bacterium]